MNCGERDRWIGRREKIMQQYRMLITMITNSRRRKICRKLQVIYTRTQTIAVSYDANLNSFAKIV